MNAIKEIQHGARAISVASAARAQGWALVALSHAGFQPELARLVWPRVNVRSGGGPISHLYISLFVEKEYEPIVPIPECPRIVDFGAHIGFASIYFASQFPGCRLTSVEANPATFAILSQNLAPFSGVELIRGAVSDHDGTAEFFVTATHKTNVNASLFRGDAGKERLDSIQVNLLDARRWLSEPTDILKIDIEGGEYALLDAGLVRRDRVRFLAIEMHGVRTEAERFRGAIRRLAGDLGFRIYTNENEPVTPDEAIAFAERSGDAAVFKLA
jgi:FkbM family methyltransferase